MDRSKALSSFMETVHETFYFRRFFLIRLADQLVSTSSVLNSALQSRQLLQVVGSPQVLAGLQDGSLSVMRSAGQMTGNAINTSTHKLAGQLRFAPANMGRIVGPLAVWQIINAAAGVTHLQKINAKLDALQREMERLTIRLQAKTYGQIVAAIEILQDLSNQHAIIGTFSSDMTMRLAVAEHAIRTSFAEQRFLGSGLITRRAWWQPGRWH